METPIAMPPSLAAMVEGYGWHPVEAGESGGTVHRLEAAGRETLFLKHGRARVANDIANEAARLRWIAPLMPTAQLRLTIADEDGAWLLTTALAGRSADDWFDAAPDRRSGVIRACAAFLRQLHALPVDACPFAAAPPLRLLAARRNLDAGIVDTDDFSEDHTGWSAQAVWDEMMTLRPDTIDPVVTHGDYSLGNILLDAAGEVTGIIDLGRVGVADRYQDIAIFWDNLRGIDDALAALLLDAYGIDALDDRKLRFHLCLDEFF